MKLASCKNALTRTHPPPPHPVVCTTDRCKAVVPVIVLLLVALWFISSIRCRFYSTRRFVVCLSMCHFVLVFFSPFSVAITSLGEERANLSAFRTFVRFLPSLDLSVSSSSLGLGRAAICDCGTLTFFFSFKIKRFLLLFFFFFFCLTGIQQGVDGKSVWTATKEECAGTNVDADDHKIHRRQTSWTTDRLLSETL